MITGRVLEELDYKTLNLITIIFNAIMRIEYQPDQWKVAQIVILVKLAEPLQESSSYRPISLLPVKII